MVWPTPTARRRETFMLFAYPTGATGNVVSKGVNELIIPNYKQTWEISASSRTPAGDASPLIQKRRIHAAHVTQLSVCSARRLRS